MLFNSYPNYLQRTIQISCAFRMDILRDAREVNWALNMFRTANGSVREEISGSNFTQGRGNYNLTFNPQIYVIPCPISLKTIGYLRNKLPKFRKERNELGELARKIVWTKFAEYAILSQRKFSSIHIYIYIHDRIDEKRPIGQSHVQRSCSANSYRNLPFSSLLVALNGCACARTNREQASRCNRTRCSSRTGLTRARTPLHARSSSAHGVWKVARHRRARTS